jgi:ComF family protein
MLCAAPAQQHMLCAGCARDLPWRSGPKCPICAVPTGTGSACGQCLKSPPAFDATHAVLEYRFPVNAVLQRYKYSGLLAVSELMGQLLARNLQAASLPELLIPMPLHPTRLQERGFNQATELARVVAKALDIPLSTQLCSRTRPTQPQTGLAFKERKRNMRGVFACSQSLAGKHVALLDDVMTTGASLDALARAVKDAGAARVDCWVIARTLPT